MAWLKSSLPSLSVETGLLGAGRFEERFFGIFFGEAVLRSEFFIESNQATQVLSSIQKLSSLEAFRLLLVN